MLDPRAPRSLLATLALALASACTPDPAPKLAPAPISAPTPTPAPPPTSEPDPVSEAQLTPFIDALADRRYDQALDLYAGYARAPRDDPRVRAGFAGWLHLGGHTPRALEELRALEQTTGDLGFDVLSLLGLILGDADRCNEALAYHRRAAAAIEPLTAPVPALWIDYPRVFPTDARALAHYFHGKTLDRCDRAGVVDTLERALAIDPRLAQAHTWIGAYHRSKGRFDDADAAYQRAIAADPLHAGALIELGALREAQCRFPEALDLLDRGWRRDPFDTRDAPYQLCFAYARAGRTADSLRACRSYLEHNRDADDADEIQALVDLSLSDPAAVTAIVQRDDEARCDPPDPA